MRSAKSSFSTCSFNRNVYVKLLLWRCYHVEMLLLPRGLLRFCGDVAFSSNSNKFPDNLSKLQMGCLFDDWLAAWLALFWNKQQQHQNDHFSNESLFLSNDQRHERSGQRKNFFTIIFPIGTYISATIGHQCYRTIPKTLVGTWLTKAPEHCGLKHQNIAD